MAHVRASCHIQSYRPQSKNLGGPVVVSFLIQHERHFGLGHVRAHNGHFFRIVVPEFGKGGANPKPLR
jgi:hypothetical protein